MPSRLFRTVVLSVTLVLAVSALSATPSLKAGGLRGYCSCGCSFAPDCSTDADCGGGRCLKGPTCC
jgi:hypothetical protein